MSAGLLVFDRRTVDQKPLTPRLLAAAAKLKELAVGGVVIGTSVDIKARLGLGSSTIRSLRNLLADLEAAGVIERQAGRGPGASLSIRFRKAEGEAERKAEEAEGEAEKAETEGGRGEAKRGSPQLSTAPKEKAAAAASRAGLEAEGIAEREAEKAEGIAEIRTVVVRLDASPTLLLLLARIASALEGSHKPAAIGDTLAPESILNSGVSIPGYHKPDAEPKVPAPGPPQAAPQGLPSPEQRREAEDFRTDQERPRGFKTSEAAFRKHLRRSFAGNPREVFEILDEKRELLEAKGRAPALPTLKPAIPVVIHETPAQAKARLAEIERQRAERLRQKIQENGALR